MAKRENSGNAVQVTNKQLKDLYCEMGQIWHLLAGAQALLETNITCASQLIRCAKCSLQKAGKSIEPLIDFGEPDEPAEEPVFTADFIRERSVHKMCITRSQDGDKPENRRPKCAASRARSPRPTDRPTSVSKDTGNRDVRLTGAPARTHAKGGEVGMYHGTNKRFKRWRKKQFGGDFDPVAAAVDEAVRLFSRKNPEQDRAVWLRVANQIGVDAFRDKMRQMQAQIDEARHNCAPIANLAGYFQMMLNRYTDHKKGV